MKEGFNAEEVQNANGVWEPNSGVPPPFTSEYGAPADYAATIPSPPWQTNEQIPPPPWLSGNQAPIPATPETWNPNLGVPPPPPLWMVTGQIPPPPAQFLEEQARAAANIPPPPPWNPNSGVPPPFTSEYGAPADMRSTELQRGTEESKEVVPLSFTREELNTILNNPEHTPEEILGLLERDFKELLSQGVGVWEGYSLRDHTLMVMRQYKKYFGDANLHDKDIFEFMLALHDMGKPIAVSDGQKHKQHEYTKRVAVPVLTQLGYTASEVNLVESLIGGDPIGSYLRNEDISRAAESVVMMAQKSGLDIDSFWDMLIAYYQVDAGSYTEDAGGLHSLDDLFSFDPDSQTMTFAPHVATKISRLKEAVKDLVSRPHVEDVLSDSLLSSNQSRDLSPVSWNPNSGVPPPFTSEYGAPADYAATIAPPPFQTSGQISPAPWSSNYQPVSAAVEIQSGSMIPPPFKLQEERMSTVSAAVAETAGPVSNLKERGALQAEQLTAYQVSKELLSEERNELAAEIWAERKRLRGALDKLKNNIALSESIEVNNDVANEQLAAVDVSLSDAASRFALSIEQPIEDGDQNEVVEIVHGVIDVSEAARNMRARIREHYDAADMLAREKFDEIQRSLETVIVRNNAFIVHVIAEQAGVRHNENSNVASDATYEDDIDILLSLEPSISTSSVKPGEGGNLWPGASGFFFGGGQISEAGHGDIGTTTQGIKVRQSGSRPSTIEEIDGVVGRTGGGTTMNEMVLNNPEVAGFFQHAEFDDEGKCWAYGLSTRDLSIESKRERGRGAYTDALKNNITKYKKRFAVAQDRGVPLFIMTPDRRVLACTGVNEDGSVEVGVEISPTEVASGKAGLTKEKRLELGERVVTKKLFRDERTMSEAENIVRSLDENE